MSINSGIQQIVPYYDSFKGVKVLTPKGANALINTSSEDTRELIREMLYILNGTTVDYTYIEKDTGESLLKEYGIPVFLINASYAIKIGHVKYEGMSNLAIEYDTVLTKTGLEHLIKKIAQTLTSYTTIFDEKSIREIEMLLEIAQHPDIKYIIERIDSLTDLVGRKTYKVKTDENNNPIEDENGNYIQEEIIGAEYFNSYEGENKNLATGEYSHSEGYNSKANGKYAHVENNSNIASGESSHAGGELSEAAGRCSFAHGWNAHATGDYSIALGGDVYPSNFYSISIGQTSHNDAQSSITIGSQLEVPENCNNQIILGSMNLPDTEAYFTIGKDDLNNDEGRGNIFTIKKDGRVTTPKGDLGITPFFIKVASDTLGLNNHTIIDLGNKYPSSNYDIQIDFDTSAYNSLEEIEKNYEAYLDKNLVGDINNKLYQLGENTEIVSLLLTIYPKFKETEVKEWQYE